jgi:hypothetical protein
MTNGTQRRSVSMRTRAGGLGAASGGAELSGVMYEHCIELDLVDQRPDLQVRRTDPTEAERSA